MIIEKYKTVTISNYFNDSDNFDVNINIPFQVDEIVIKHVSWVDGQFNIYPKPSDPLDELPAVKRSYLIKTNLITNSNFYIVGGEYFNSYLDIRYQTGGDFIQSKYNFQVCMLDGSNILFNPADVDDLLDMRLSLTLEFRKYRD